METIPRIYFVSGVSGVGKTSTLKQLKNILPSEQYDVRDLDERGVPDGGGLEWLIRETRHWIDVANENAQKGKATIICGFANPDVFENVHTPSDIPAKLILLDASGAIIKDRLTGRYPTQESIEEIKLSSGTTLEAFIENCVSFAPELREIFEKRNLPIVATDNKSPQEVGKEVARIITSDQ